MANDYNRQGEMRKWNISVTVLHMTQWLMIGTKMAGKVKVLVISSLSECDYK